MLVRNKTAVVIFRFAHNAFISSSRSVSMRDIDKSVVAFQGQQFAHQAISCRISLCNNRPFAQRARWFMSDVKQERIVCSINSLGNTACLRRSGKLSSFVRQSFCTNFSLPPWLDLDSNSNTMILHRDSNIYRHHQDLL